jgi:RNA polymerase sigma factor (sigma-70 family)
MDTVQSQDESTEAETLMYVSAIARRLAEEYLDRDGAYDLAQDLVLECLVKIRRDNWRIEPSTIRALVRRMVERRLIDVLRRKQNQAAHNNEHASDLQDSVHVWMCPDLAVEAQELEAFHERTLASLSDGCRRAYTMVRDEGMPYQTVADWLGVSRAAVHWHVVGAQRRFRTGLAEEGIATPPRTCGRQSRDANLSTRDAEFSPCDDEFPPRDADRTRRDADLTPQDADFTPQDADARQRYSGSKQRRRRKRRRPRRERLATEH